MMFKKLAVAAALSAGVAAQRPANESICDYYTTALLMNNTAANQATLLTLVVNTVVIGNYTKPNVGITVPGILAKGTYNGTDVNLAPYFTGALLSSNRGGKVGVSVNFLDGGGAAPLMDNKPSNDTNSNQELLLTHLYEFFGALLGCTMQGNSDFSAYSGQASMYEVHKFMDLSAAQVGYFITQVGMAAASFGVADADVQAVGMALQSTFGYSCAPAMAVIPSQGPQLQAICIDPTCPESVNATCGAYETAFAPANATSTSSGGASSTASGTATGTAASTSGKASETASSTGNPTATPSGVTNAANTATFSTLAVVAAGVFALLL